MPDPTARLLASTRRRLTIVTLTLIALLVLGIGAATAFVGLRALDADVDRALTASVDAAIASLDKELPQSDGSDELSEITPAVADTVLYYLAPDGTLVADPSRAVLPGLPDQAAAVAAATYGSDLRTIDAGGVPVRLLTKPVAADGGTAPIGFVQGGFVLTLHDEQSGSLITAVALVAFVGLVGAAVVTLVVTGDALVPIRRSLDAQRRFVADASHELKTPPALIRANAEVLEREALVRDDGRPLVTDIVTETDRLSRLVGDLLQLASADATGLTVDRGPIDLAALAADTARGAKALAAERGVGLAFDGGADATPIVVSGDADRLTQLILILLDNAFDHTPAGTTVHMAVTRAGRRAELTVTDAGPGIPLADRDRVFEPFTRLPGVRRDGATGTGLGLAIAQRITAAHDGTITAGEGPGGGARFTVSLPARTDDSTA